jgi:hypothetical protein
MTRPDAPPSLRVNIRRRLVDAAIRQSVLAPESFNSIATVRLENATFQPAEGLSLACNGNVRLLFADRSTLQIIVTPLSQTVVKGHPVVHFGPNHISVSNLGIELNAPAIAVVGEMSHTRFLGYMSISPTGGPEAGLLPPKDSTRPFAIKVPSLAA